ncbi:L domain-like protein [Piromyces finnis]|uniref:L domain-like protein n=1 Tax=Piromyces finnis TaxID=1754191 RepID=A0A1Y1VKQ1_9FUNG|nr:L domain-like protein [Piromyces finnis]|eukprot:ORX57948.1 L domain-like protein [Piromyces finnis]
MNIKFILKSISLGLLIGSYQKVRALNCEEIKTTLPEDFDIEDIKCIENEKGEITKFVTTGIFTEDVIKNISSLNKLEELELYHYSYKDDFDLSPLKSLKNLKSLYIRCYKDSRHISSSSKIKENSFSELKSLEKLDLSGCDIMGDKPFIGLSNLKELNLYFLKGLSIPDLSYINNLKNITSLNLNNSYNVRSMDINYEGLNNLKKLFIYGLKISKENIKEISTLENIEELNVSKGEIDSDSDFSLFKSLKDTLKYLDISLYRNGDFDFPEAFVELTNLKNLTLSKFINSKIPKEISQLKNLESLYIKNPEFNEIPETIKELKNLKYLDLEGNFEKLPESIGELYNLEVLDLEGDIKELPESIGELYNLEVLNLSNNQIENLPETIKNLENLKNLYLHNNNLYELPESLCELKNLKTLYMSNENNLTEISGCIKKLNNLEIIDLSENEITKIPEAIKELDNLEYLDLSHNKLTEIPEAVKELKSLISLDLSYNDIKEFPEFLNELTNLETIDISDNENIVGKTLINSNIQYCYYLNTKLCIAEEESCGYDSGLPYCKPKNDCEEIQSFLLENDFSSSFITCDLTDNKATSIAINEIVTEEVIDKILSYDTIEHLYVEIDGSINVIKKISQKLPNLVELTIINNNESLDLSSLKTLENLTQLRINSYESLISISKNSLKYLTNLEYLELSSSKIYQKNLDEIGKLTKLKSLIFDNCHYPSSLDYSPLKKLQSLEVLIFHDYYRNKTPLYEIPSSIYKLTNLKELTIEYQKISSISSNISKLEKLNYLNLSGNKITSIPKALNNMKNLRYVEFLENPKLSGKTLTNENLTTCYYDTSSSICKAKEMKCFGEEGNPKLCKK